MKPENLMYYTRAAAESFGLAMNVMEIVVVYKELCKIRVVGCTAERFR